MLDIANEVKQQLEVKHREASPKFDSLLLNNSLNKVHNVIFGDITEELSQRSSIRTKGAAAPSTFDTGDWWWIIRLNIFGGHNSKLWKLWAKLWQVMLRKTAEI